jgi:divinyl protochlorophyllide a 8-vinyl-reductase
VRGFAADPDHRDALDQGEPRPPAGRVGPNAIIQVGNALPGLVGIEAARSVFRAARLESLFDTPPQEMVDERDVRRLHDAVRNAFAPALAQAVLAAAGRRTGDYLLAHRIPRPAQVMLRVLPSPASGRLLAGAIRRHAWTFAGSGEFTVIAGRPLLLEIRRNPVCSKASTADPRCFFFAATFQRLFERLVDPLAIVIESECEARGAGACRFRVSFGRASAVALT